MKDDNNHLQKEIVPNKLVPLATFNGREEAYLIRGKLQSEGIVSFVVDDHPSCLWSSSIVQLQVKESDAINAKRILDETSPKCPVCASIDVTNRYSHFYKNLRLKCQKCGYEWKLKHDDF